MKFGYVSLGGQKFEAFLWELEDEPGMFEAVVLYSEKALEQKLVGNLFRVPEDRAFFDDNVAESLTAESAQLADICRTKLENNEKFGRRVSFCFEPSMKQNVVFRAPVIPMEVLEASCEVEEETIDVVSEEMELANQMSEAEMLMEVEMMLRMDSATPSDIGGGPVDFLEDDDFIEGAMLYEAETFGGKMVDDDKRDTSVNFIRKASTIKRPLIKQFLDSPQLSLKDSIRGLRRELSQKLAPSPDLTSWSMDLEDKVVEDVCLKLQQTERKRMARFSTNFTTTPDLHGDLPPVDDEPTLGARQAAFVSTRGKEREIWQTYRDEITQTWKAELEELRRELFHASTPSHVGA